MLSAMGHELASIHCGSLDKNDIEADFLARKSGWLLEAVTAVAKAITAEQKAWKKHPEKWPRPPKESG
jgi:hypothetical protein